MESVRSIIDADPESDLSFDEIAEVSGIARRTIFRHFPTKEALLDAFWEHTNASLGVPFWPRTEKDLTQALPGLFEALDEVESIARAAHMSGAARKMRLRANDQRQVVFRESLAEVTKDMSPAEARKIHAVVQLLFSATAWMTMKDCWQLSGREAGEAAAWAIEAVLSAARRDQSDKRKKK